MSFLIINEQLYNSRTCNETPKLKPNFRVKEVFNFIAQWTTNNYSLCFTLYLINPLLMMLLILRVVKFQDHDCHCHRFLLSNSYSIYQLLGHLNFYRNTPNIKPKPVHICKVCEWSSSGTNAVEVATTRNHTKTASSSGLQSLKPIWVTFVVRIRWTYADRVARQADSLISIVVQFSWFQTGGGVVETWRWSIVNFIKW